MWRERPVHHSRARAAPRPRHRHQHRTGTGTGTGTSIAPSGPEPTAESQSLAKPATPEEKYEYDANEGRCEDDHGTIRNVGTIDAYCAFPVRSNDFHLIEPAQQKDLAGEEE